MSIESRLQLLLVHTNPGLSELVAVLPREAGRLHNAANDGGVKQFLKRSWSDIIPNAPSRRVTKFAGEQKERGSIELGQLVEFVCIQVAKVNLGPRRQRRRLNSVGLGIFTKAILLPFSLTTLTTAAHFFCRVKSSREALTKS
jgi:hypothetical protein